MAVGLGLIGGGLSPLIRGSAFYQNYWGGAVFAPFTVIIGGVVLFIGIFQLGQKRHEASRQMRKHHR